MLKVLLFLTGQGKRRWGRVKTVLAPLSFAENYAKKKREKISTKLEPIIYKSFGHLSPLVTWAVGTEEYSDPKNTQEG